ncbi:MAG: cobalamin biosynthesis protein CbiM [Propioniciclava sp.]|nr:cobalamin biosynthesis protein CbiM [Propioniciclava sp.]
MHVPDHMFHDPAEVVAAAGAVAALTAALRPRRAAPAAGDGDGRTLVAHPERLASQAATAALVFGLQMVNVPVLPGTSGHLLGGALATVLIGPRRALLAVASVVVTQALLFGDGGIGALGINLWLIAILPVALAAAATALVRRRVPHGGFLATASAAGIAALLAPPLAAAAFTGFHALGGAARVDVGELAARMVGIHLAIGVVEAVLTLAVLAAVAAAGERAVPAAALVSAGGLSVLASSAPDGLERVAGDLGFAVTGGGSLLPVGAEGNWSIAAAGLTGAVLAAGLLAVAAVLVRGRAAAASAPAHNRPA